MRPMRLPLSSAIAGAQAGERGRAAGLDLAQHRLAPRTAEPDALHQPGIDVGDVELVEFEADAMLAAALAIAHQQFEALAAQGRLRHLPAQVGQRAHVGPREPVARGGTHPVAGVQAGRLGDAVRHGKTEHRLGFVDADPVRAGIQRHREQQVGRRPRRDDRGALRQGLAVECAIALVGSNGALALVEHLHVSAERQRADRELGAALRPPTPEHAPEADREPQHLHAAGHRHAIVAVFVDDDEHSERQREGEDRRDHAESSLTSCPARMRARASRSSSPSSEPATPGSGTSASTVPAFTL